MLIRLLYGRLDRLLMRVVPERGRLWFKGVCIVIAQTLCPSKFGRSNGLPTILPRWVSDALREASTDELELAPELLAPYLKRLHMPEGASALGNAYVRLSHTINWDARHVFILGDSDCPVPEELLASINSMAIDPKRRVVVVWTGSGTSGFDQTLLQAPPLRLSSVSGVDGVIQQAVILGRVLIEIRPTTIHVVSSEIGWTVLKMMAAALTEQSIVYAELPAIETGDGVATRHTVAASAVTCGLSDTVRLLARSNEIVSRWKARYGVDPAECNVVRNDVAVRGTCNGADAGSTGWLDSLPGYDEI